MPNPVRDEVTALLQGLLRLNTVNPPGNETLAAEFLRAYLEENGVACELYARTPERANLVARIQGTGDGPRLLLLSHTDTVLADPEEWTVDPWSGDLKDGCVWGRGALDMKSQVAASAVAIASLAREGWLCEHYPDAVRCDYAINEGAGDRLELGGRVFYLCSTAEKRSSPCDLVVHGRSGHASMPGIADNALGKAAGLIERVAEFREEPQLGPETEGFLDALTGAVPEAEDALDAARAVDPVAAEVLEPLLTMTVAPTMISASHKRNVIPGTCLVTVDCRLRPGQTQEEVGRRLHEWLGPGDYELQWRDGQGGTRSARDTKLWKAVEEFVARIEPPAVVVPTCVPGFTDSHWLRESFGAVAYGFFPLKEMSSDLASRLIHSADERIAVADLELGLDFLRHAALSLGS